MSRMRCVPVNTMIKLHRDNDLLSEMFFAEIRNVLDFMPAGKKTFKCSELLPCQCR